MVKVIGIDGDDTLWELERVFLEVKDSFEEILVNRFGQDSKDLLRTKIGSHLKRYGYGIATASHAMIESYIELNGVLESGVLEEIRAIENRVIDIPATPYDGVEETLSVIQDRFMLLLLTKGHNHEQLNKIKRSGLEQYFHAIEIMAEKDEESYSQILSKFKVSVEDFVMVGNSDKSDIIPVLNIGGRAIHIPNEHVWHHEVASEHSKQGGLDFPVIQSFSQLPQALAELNL